MAGLRSLFRRKSKKNLRPETPAASDLPPSPARLPPSNSWTNSSRAAAAAAPSTAAGTYPPPGNTRGSTARTQQQPPPRDPSTFVENGAPSYDRLPQGRPPERGSYPLHGNATAAFPADRASTQSLSNERSASLGRPANTQKTTRPSDPLPGTAVTTDDSYQAQRPISRTSGYADSNRYTEDVPNSRPQGIPPVPKSTIRVVSESTLNGTGEERPRQHQRLVSSSSQASLTPIADEFTSASWYNQRGSPPIPSFSELHPDNSTLHNSTSPQGSVAAPETSPTTRQYPEDMRTSRGNGTSPSQRYQTETPPNGQMYPNDEGPTSAKSQRTSIPRRSLDKPLPVPNELQMSGSRNNSGSQRGQTQSLSIRDDARFSGQDERAAQYQQENGSRSYGNTESQQLNSGREYERTADSRHMNTAGFSEKSAYPQQVNASPTYERDADARQGNSSQALGRSAAAQQVNANRAEPVQDFSQRSQEQPSQSDLQLVQTLSGRSSVQPGKYGGRELLSAPQAEVRSGPQQAYNRPYVVQGAANPPSLEGIIDLGHTTDTSTHVNYAPAIIHETVRPYVHNIREERITREIHNEQIHHRILPIVDVQVMPAKHFVRSYDGPEGEWREVPLAAVPGRNQHQNWLIAETVSKMVPGRPDATARAPRQFTARRFEGSEGDYAEYTNAEGVPTTETTWVHPPRIADGARLRGITLPLDMD